MPTTVGTRVPANAMKSAAIGLGLSVDAAKAAVIRGALALFHDLDPNLYMEPPRKPVGRGAANANSDLIDVSAPVPPELAVKPDGVDRATAIRIGLAMARGWSREDATEWAQNLRETGLYKTGKPMGRPPKRESNATT